MSPGGGHTANVLVKSANNGYDIYILLQWHDDQGPSFGSASEIYQAQNGTLLPLDPASTSNVGQLFYNSTYYYQDRAAVLWFLPSASNRQQSPVMELGSSGAITGGAADIWHWQSVPTDNSSNDTDFPGGYTDPSGNPIFPSDNLSFAEDDYTNTTGFFVIAGSFGQDSPNLVPNADPYIVHVENWCNNGDQNSAAGYSRMRDALAISGRPIVFSICEWGSTKPWLWAKDIGNLWRTTGDIQDIWEGRKAAGDWVSSTSSTSRPALSAGGPGRLERPRHARGRERRHDHHRIRGPFQLVVHSRRAAHGRKRPADDDPGVTRILTNKEVIAVNQDPLGRQGRKVRDDGDHEVWSRALADGSRAITLFNRSSKAAEITVHWPEIG